MVAIMLLVIACSDCLVAGPSENSTAIITPAARLSEVADVRRYVADQPTPCRIPEHATLQPSYSEGVTVPAISTCAINALLQQPGAAVVKLYLLLLAEADERTANTTTSVRLLAHKLAVTDRTVMSELRTLEDIGLIRREPRNPGPFLTTYAIAISNDVSLSALASQARDEDVATDDDPLPSIVGRTHDPHGGLSADQTGPVESKSIARSASPSSGIHPETQSTASTLDITLKHLAGWYRPLTDAEQNAAHTFIVERLGNRAEEWVSALVVNSPSVCPDSPFQFFLAVLADNARRASLT